MKKLIACLLSLVFLASLLPSTACAPSVYKNYTHKSEVGSFSFEYPKAWLVEEHSDGGWDGLRLFFGSSLPRELGKMPAANDTAIFIESCAQDYFPDKSQALDWLGYGLPPTYAPPNDTIIRSKIIIDEMEADALTYSVEGDNYFYLSHMTFEEVGIDYSGRSYVFTLVVDTDRDNYKPIRLGFDHILETFKFLS